jgi:hypothetical protein
MTKFDLKDLLGDLVGDCVVYNEIKETETGSSSVNHVHESEWESNDLIEPERALTSEEIIAVRSSLELRD